MTYETILYSIESGAAWITLNRPDSYNACNEQLTTDLAAALKAAAEDKSVRAIVLTGAGKAFCSGQDLKDAPTGSGKRSLADSLERRYNPIIRAIRSTPKPVICGVNGVAAGAGLSLALACDYRLMSAEAKFVEAFAAIALVPDSGAGFFYPRMMGYTRAFEFATLNAPIPASEALRLGMVNQVVSSAVFSKALKAVAKKFAEGPTGAFGMVKEMLSRGMNSSLEEMLKMETEYQQRAGESQDYAEGVKAFVEKRPAKFTGA